MKRIPTMLGTAVATLGVLALSACGSSGSSSGTPTTGSSITPPTSTSPTSSAPDTSASSATSAPTTTGAAALPSAPGSITIGSAAFPENEMLADIYGDAMTAKGVKVSKHLNIGERGVYMAALSDGSIGFVPEYSGSILPFLDPKATAKTSADVYTALQKQAGAKGFTALKYAAAQDSDTITVTATTASKYKLAAIGDLASVAGKLTLGAPAQFKTRPDGVPALKSVYGVSFGRFVPLDTSGISATTALNNGSIDASDIFSTDGSIAKYKYVVLKDTKNMFAAQNVVPLFKSSVLSQPMKDACDAVSAKLDTATLAKLVAEVAGGMSPDAVAMAWLKQNGLS